MKRSLRIALSALGITTLLAMSATPALAATQHSSSSNSIQPTSVPLPKPMLNQDNPKKPGTWFLGATPPNVNNQPPIVFVQGLHGEAQSYWWGDTTYYGHNEMYELAYQNGFRTAFVQLYDANGEAQTPWENGRLLAETLQKIYAYFGQKVNIVGHSKGGVDTQAALVHYNAYPYVNKAISLASPHHGSNLADLAYSWYAGWLAELLGRKDKGTESLQTGNMKKFREQTDSHTHVNKNKYYTSAGTHWGPTFKALWFGGSYLSQYGPNDGMVNEWSTKLPYGNHMFTAKLDHDQMRKGSEVFPKIVSNLTASSNLRVEAPKVSTPPQPMEESVTGGPLKANQSVEKYVSVDSSAKEAVFNLLTKYKNTKVTLISPSGKIYNNKSTVYHQNEDKEFFKGANQQAFVIKQPEAGQWKVKINSKQKDAYLLTTYFNGADTVSVHVDQTVKANQNIPIQVQLNQPEKYDLSSLKVIMKTVSTDKKRTSQPEAKPNGKGKLIKELKASAKSGTMNITVEIKGKTKDGKPFERTEVVSIHVAN
ncbi:esterase/lipase family protein [Thermoflavimicrobium daqui]|uniref:Uncharacterized protein n=1 Tax=Thermoflavimicrobium daqui TaxID=2137476 RepID=A0A364K7D0_9BACL|nr:hypothetical protein [Thermoflavimicrobium daqui]RAL26197.1 hypothetical protein DL897_04150 [Thermoflavimicrobium daqui]